MTSLLTSFGKLYSLDTLDTRFTISPTTPPKQAASETRIDPTKPSQEDLKSLNGQPNGYNGARKGLRTRPSLWNTPEFYLYYIIFILVVPVMFWVVIDVSRPSHPNYEHFAPLLKDGWIPGRKVDDSDSQYEGFREHILYMLLLPILHPLLRKAYDYFYRIDLYAPQTLPSPRSQLTQGLTGNAAADARLEHRITFDVFFASIFIIALHGFSAPKVVLILYTNYRATKTLPKEYIPAFSYIFNIGILFANELCRGYPYSEIGAFITPWASSVAEDGVHINWGNYLDRNGGLTPRWEILFNFTVLRLISFNMDYYWSLNQQGSSPIEVRRYSSSFPIVILIRIRRNNSILPPSPSVTASPHPPNPPTTLSANTTPTLSILHYTSPGPLSHSTITSPNYAIAPPVSPPSAPFSTACASSSLCSQWRS